MILLYIGWMFGVLGVNALKFDTLPDGIIVSTGENINVIEGEWTVLLTVHKTSLRYTIIANKSLCVIIWFMFWPDH